MKHRRTRALQYADIADAVKCINEGTNVKRSTYKDGSIPIKPVVLVDDKKLERDVKADCLKWLRQHHVFCNPHGCGSFTNKHGQRRMYGIKHSGDIHGMFRYDGRHFEIECKRGSGGKLSAGQQKRMKDVEDNSGLYFVCHGVEELEYFMRDYV